MIISREKIRMTPKDLENLLKEKGITPGQWTKAGSKQVKPPFVEEQVRSLEQLRSVLEGELESLQTSKTNAFQALNHLKYGGGK